MVVLRSGRRRRTDGRIPQDVSSGMTWNAPATRLAAGCLFAVLLSGCSGIRVDFTKISRPARAPELDAYNVFVGSWDWEAWVENADGADRKWTGTAEWKWSLDQRVLEGDLAAASPSAQFKARGLWSWHPTRYEYIWTLFNDWGYPQHGRADYDAKDRCWRMKYTSIGLDGTKSYGRYIIRVVDNDTLDWRLEEWATRLHLIKKLDMSGTYKRKPAQP